MNKKLLTAITITALIIVWSAYSQINQLMNIKYEVTGISMAQAGILNSIWQLSIQLNNPSMNEIVHINNLSSKIYSGNILIGQGALNDYSIKNGINELRINFSINHLSTAYAIILDGGQLETITEMNLTLLGFYPHQVIINQTI